MVEQRLRQMQLALVGFAFAGLMVELYFAEHFLVPIQFVAWGSCIAGLAAVILMLSVKQRAIFIVGRIVMVAIIVSALLGIYQHLAVNIAFERDVLPDASFGELLRYALRGNNPLFAPAGLALGASFALIATYKHPVLSAS